MLTRNPAANRTGAIAALKRQDTHVIAPHFRNPVSAVIFHGPAPDSPARARVAQPLLTGTPGCGMATNAIIEVLRDEARHSRSRPFSKASADTAWPEPTLFARSCPTGGDKAPGEARPHGRLPLARPLSRTHEDRDGALSSAKSADAHS
jgi:hypothetical protein